MIFKKSGVDPTALPKTSAGVARTPRVHPWRALAAQMVASRGEWFEYDGFIGFDPVKSPVRTYAARINNGKLLCLAEFGRFEAVARGRILHIRFLGE